MISANNITLRVGKKALFEDVKYKFQKVTAMVSSVQMVPVSLPSLKFFPDS